MPIDGWISSCENIPSLVRMISPSLSRSSLPTGKRRNLSISVNDLAQGKRIDCKNIVEMLAIEEHIKEAARTFRAILEAARTFGGEEVVKID